MSVSVTFNGSLYIIPTNNDVGWGTNLTNYLVAIAAGSLQKTGGTFLLSAETDFGAAFGLKALYYKSRTANIADAGIIRMANNSDSIAWRNFANTGNHLLAVDSSDLLTFDGVPVAVGGSGTVLTGTANTLAYYPASTNTVDDLPAITALRALQSDASGLPIASATTATELGYVSGVTSAIQTQLNTKATDSLVVHLAGTETITGQKIFSLSTLIADGTSGTPGLAFSGDTNTGLFRSTSDELDLVAGGTTQLSLTMSSAIFSQVLRAASGAVSTPGISFSGDSDTGLYNTGSNVISFAAGGTNTFEISTVGSGSIDGTVSQPSLYFLNDINTGIYRIGADNLGITAGSVKIVDVKSTGPSFVGTIGTQLAATSVVKTDGSGNLTTGTVSLTTQVSGTLPTANGGTGLTSKLMTTGTYTGNGTSQNIAHGLGVVPDFIIIADNTTNNNIPIMFITGMGADSHQYNGVRQTNGITAKDATNFSVGSNNSANQNTVTYSWFAFKAQ